MIRTALPKLPLQDIDLLFIENVGNLVCPAEFALGADLAAVIASTPEGHDKPYKYPGMFAAADAVVLNKAENTTDRQPRTADRYHRSAVSGQPSAVESET